ncbi:MAG TPA: DUF1440 domain-containing protein [Ktedonobacteraceae bacterium]|nr:DUF1440 domain-containing protein [Ktedonobacteraceae bacterium]
MIRDLNVTSQPGLSWLKGVLAGFLGTIPMTVFMLATQRFLPHGQRYALPPEIITKELAHRAKVKQHMSKMQILAVTLISHFAYGAAMGGLYSLSGMQGRRSSLAKGGLFGFIVWVGSYFGLLPILGMTEAGQREPLRRNMMMMVAHLIWGSAMGLLAEILIRE